MIKDDENTERDLNMLVFINSIFAMIWVVLAMASSGPISEKIFAVLLLACLHSPFVFWLYFVFTKWRDETKNLESTRDIKKKPLLELESQTEKVVEKNQNERDAVTGPSAAPFVVSSYDD